MKRILISILLAYCLITTCVFTIGAQKDNIASFKAEYDEIPYPHNPKTGVRTEKRYRSILQIIPTMASYYYNPQTFHVDSLENDPEGKKLLFQAQDIALHAAMEDSSKDLFELLKGQGTMKESDYRCLKDFSTNKIKVWDTNWNDQYRYDVDMNDLVWELGDSIKNIMGYECQLAYADYHGRRWEVWFAPEIAIQDGPWQLCGLPGLIMEATSVDGDYVFLIKGLQQCNEQFKDPYESENVFISTRKSFLKQKDYTRRNRSSHISAMTNGTVKVNADYTGTDDFLETDYHE